MAVDTLPDQSVLLETFSYDPETGELRWLERPATHYSSPEQCKRANAQFAGTIAGHAEPRRYVFVRCHGRNQYAHRIIFKMMTGRSPCEIDHLNRRKGDNRWVNLREATSSQNKSNRMRPIKSRSGTKGVSPHPNTKKFRARIKLAGKEKHLGLFATIEEAHAAYCAAARLLHGCFWNPG